MSKEEAKRKLQNMKDNLVDNAKKYEEIGEALEDGEASRLIWPRDDIEYQKMKRDIKDSGNED